MIEKGRKSTRANVMLILVALSISFSVIEIGYRVIDPFPYFPSWEARRTNYNNISEYDKILGWKGVSGAQELFVTQNAKVWVRHNRLGFRDIEPEQRSQDKPAIVFLGDSFTWGFEVNFDQIFGNIVRTKLPQFEVFNLSHRGYGTDQSLLTFQKWHEKRPLERVFLVFFENDIVNNNHKIQYNEQKPKFELVNNALVLENVPVPRNKLHEKRRSTESGFDHFKEWTEYILSYSHFLHDVYFRIVQLKRYAEKMDKSLEIQKTDDFALTGRIIRELHSEVIRRGGELTLITIPSKVELINNKQQIPYKQALRSICEELSVDYLDLTARFEDALVRTYFRKGIHWNSYGHRLTADAVYEYLKDVQLQ